MADFEINEDGKEAGTPLGFALFKAKSLSLTPLEVLVCLEQLSVVDQDKVMRTLNNRRSRPSKIEQLQAEIKKASNSLEAHTVEANREVSVLEAHTPEGAGGAFILSSSQAINNGLHQADALKYAMTVAQNQMVDPCVILPSMGMDDYKQSSLLAKYVRYKELLTKEEQRLIENAQRAAEEKLLNDLGITEQSDGTREEGT